MKAAKPGVTLIEVMISLVIVSLVLGMTSNLVKKGMESPFARFGVEPWIELIEASGKVVSRLPNDSVAKAIGVEEAIFKQLGKPRDFVSWKLEWKETNLPNTNVAVFSANSTGKRLYHWRVFKTTHE